MQYQHVSLSPITIQELKKRFEEIQGELRYLSYTSEVLSKELSSIFRKIEDLSDQLLTLGEEEVCKREHSS